MTHMGKPRLESFKFKQSLHVHHYVAKLILSLCLCALSPFRGHGCLIKIHHPPSLCPPLNAILPTITAAMTSYLIALCLQVSFSRTCFGEEIKVL